MTTVGVFGCKSTTKFMLENLAEAFSIAHCVTIGPDLGYKNQVADYCDLTETAREFNVNVYHARKYSLKDEVDIQAINALGLDLVFVIGWQRLVPDAILSRAKIGFFGMHGSSMNLPLGRGRSPMNWSLIEDRQFFYTNLFKYDAGVDSGAILDTFLFSITPHDTAETMHYKNMLAMKRLLYKNRTGLLENNFTLQAQVDTAATYYPKRDPSDSLIDWNRDIFYLERFIRAVTRPFNGAYTYSDNAKVTIYRAHIFETALVDYGYSHLPVGSVVEVLPGGKFLVNCHGGVLIVHEYESPVAIQVGMRFHTNGEEVHYFALNKFGAFDLEREEARPAPVVA